MRVEFNNASVVARLGSEFADLISSLADFGGAEGDSLGWVGDVSRPDAQCESPAAWSGECEV